MPDSFLPVVAVVNYPFRFLTGLLCLIVCGLRAAGDEVVSALAVEPAADRWMYPHNSTPGARVTASTYTALPMPASESGVDDRFAQFIFKFDSVAMGIPAGLGPENYDIHRIIVTAFLASDTGIIYDPTPDPLASYGPGASPDPDMGRPLEIYGTGFRNGFVAATFLENSPFRPAPTEAVPNPLRNAYAVSFGPQGLIRDVSHNITQGFESVPWAIGKAHREVGAQQHVERSAGEVMVMHDKIVFELDLSILGIREYVTQGLHEGFLWFTISSLHSASEMGTTGFPAFFTKEHPENTTPQIVETYGHVAPRLAVEYSLPLRLAIQRDASTQNVNLQWNAAPGFRYTVQRSETLDASSWAPIAVVDATSAVPLQWQGVSTSANAFFRVLRAPFSASP